jgi:hypothetical protein
MRAKVIAKTGLSEQKIILRWMLDFHQMTIALPENKFVAYSKALSDMLSRGWTSSGEIKTNIGQFVHLGQIVLTVHHFLSRLHFQKQCAEKKRRVDINKQCREDLFFLLFVISLLVNLQYIEYPHK